jgi:phage terminase small subunit
MMEKQLTPKQQRFVEEYLVDLNATQAAIRSGYSARTAEKIGSENIRKPEIAAALAQAQRARSSRTQIDADWLLRRLAAEADADVQEIYDDDGRLKPIREWPEPFRKGLVAGFESAETPDGVVIRKIKLADRTKHLELIGRHINVGAWRDKMQHEFNGDVRIYLPDNGRDAGR